MIPEAEEEVTTLWGRKIVQNLIGGYGLIGTVRIDNCEEWVWVNLALTQQFQFVPSVHMYVSMNGDGNLKYYSSAFSFGHSVQYVIMGDALGFFSVRAKNGTYFDVFYRLHGV